jgi:hypothetical protein
MTVDRAVRVIDFKVNDFSVVNKCSNLANASHLQGNDRISGYIFKMGLNPFRWISSFILILMFKATVRVNLCCWKGIVKCPRHLKFGSYFGGIKHSSEILFLLESSETFVIISVQVVCHNDSFVTWQLWRSSAGVFAIPEVGPTSVVFRSFLL